MGGVSFPALEPILKGIPEGDQILISGPPGSGKSILSMQFIHEGVKKGENGVFFTLDSEKEFLINQMKGAGIQVDKLIAEGKMDVIELDPTDIYVLMDEIDKRIIEILLKDANTPLSRVADMMEIPRPTVYARFNKMREDGSIKGFRLVLGEGVKGELKCAILRVKNYLLSEMGPRAVRKLGERLSKRSEVRFVARIGEGSLFLVWEGDTLKPHEFDEVVAVENIKPEIYKGL